MVGLPDTQFSFLGFLYITSLKRRYNLVNLNWIVCWRFQVNAVEIPSRGGFSIRAVYPRLAVAAHSCVPNIVHTILLDDYQ